MFLLHAFADEYIQLIINAILVAGIVGLILSWCSFFIQILIPYKPTIKLISCLLLIVGSYFKGGAGVEMEWRAKVAEMQKKIEIAEAKSKEVNVQIETRVVEKIKVIKEKVHENKKDIQKHKEQINAECKLPDVARVLYNRSVTHDIPGSTRDANAASTRAKAIKPE
jgi:hypothetical protein